MPYKTIVVHCNDIKRIDALLSHAVALAEREEGHLIGLSVSPPVDILPAGAPGFPDVVVIDTHRKAYQAGLPAMRSRFEAATRGRALVAEWREQDAAEISVADIVLQAARAADLVVAAQADPAWSLTGHLDIAERLAIESGRPTLVVPGHLPPTDLAGRVLVAWNGRREAARAVFDALPLLKAARQVKVVWVNPETEGGAEVVVPTADICHALARHGVKVEATEAIRPLRNAGETLLQAAAGDRSDLLVMGCYGHSRLREFVLGGATRHVLAHMMVPVLMSH